MRYFPVTEQGAAVLREAIGLAVHHVSSDGGDESSTAAGPWAQDSDWYTGGFSGTVAQSYATAHGTPLTDWHPASLSQDPKRVLAVDFHGRIERGYGDLAAHVAVIGGWKMTVDASHARPDVDLGSIVVGAPFLGAVHDPDAPTFGLPSVPHAANTVLNVGFEKQRYAGDPSPPTLIDCDPCPFERDYGYGTFARHDLFARRNTIGQIIHIADLILARDGLAPTGVTAPRRS